MGSNPNEKNCSSHCLFKAQNVMRRTHPGSRGLVQTFASTINRCRIPKTRIVLVIEQVVDWSFFSR